MTLADTLAALVADLRAMGVRFALVGGLAVSVRTEPRFTRDIDLVLAAPSDAHAEDVVRGLAGEGWSVLTQLEHDVLDRLAAVRVARSDDGVVADLLLASSGCESLIVDAADPVEVLPGLVVPTARAADLVVLKLLSRSPSRPQDEADLQALAAILDAADWERATELAQAITAVGGNRGRNLAGEVAKLRG